MKSDQSVKRQQKADGTCGEQGARYVEQPVHPGTHRTCVEGQNEKVFLCVQRASRSAEQRLDRV